MLKMSYNLEEIKDQFNKVIANSQGSTILPTSDTLFDDWFAAKYRFIKNMHDNLIYTYPDKLYFSIDENGKKRIFESFVEAAPCNLGDFLDAQGCTAFFENSVACPYRYDGTTIPKGMKLIKAFKYFFDIGDDEELRQYQDQASMLIQETKIEGYLSLSVHPLDFLSISENDCGWRSCHALNGDWRGGNLSYMVDRSTVVCYLTSKPDQLVEIPRFGDVKWNNKKWRVLLFFSPDNEIILTGRCYPYDNNFIMDQVLYTLIPSSNILAFHPEKSGSAYSPWSQASITLESLGQIGNVTTGLESTRLYPLGSRNAPLVSIKKVIKEYPYFLGFNDLTRSHYYTPRYSVLGRSNYGPATKSVRAVFPNKRDKIEIGAKVTCPYCNELEVTTTQSLYCDRCAVAVFGQDNENYARCTCCGNIFPYNEMYAVAAEDRGEIYCERCVDKVAAPCPKCSEWYTKDILESHDGYCPWCQIDLATLGDMIEI